MQALLLSRQTDESAVLRLILQRAGFNVHAVPNLDYAVEIWTDRPSELVVVTLLEDLSKALVQVRKIRANVAVPVVAITDPKSEDFYVQVLEAGADLVVVRPYGVRFLLAQIRAFTRRVAGVPFFSIPKLEQIGIAIDPSTRTVQVEEGSPVRLTNLEFRLLYTLMTHAGQIIPTENIVEHVWGYSGEGSKDLVRGLVQRLRAKIEPDSHDPTYILTEPGIGYYFQQPEDAR